MWSSPKARRTAGSELRRHGEAQARRGLAKVGLSASAPVVRSHRVWPSGRAPGALLAFAF